MQSCKRCAQTPQTYACQAAGRCHYAHTSALTVWQGAGAPEPALADDAERKVALVLEQGLRHDPRAAEAVVAAPGLQRFTLADYQQRIEALRMYGRPLAGVPVDWFRSGLKTTMLPRLAFVDSHACAPTACYAVNMLATAYRMLGMAAQSNVARGREAVCIT